MTDAILKKVASHFTLTQNQLLEESLKAFLQSRLRAVEVERQSIFASFGVSTLEELDKSIADRPDQESELLDKLQRADYLTDRVLEIQSMLADLNGHD